MLTDYAKLVLLLDDLGVTYVEDLCNPGDGTERCVVIERETNFPKVDGRDGCRICWRFTLSEVFISLGVLD